MKNDIKLYNAIDQRYSIRKYESRPVEKDKLDLVLHSAYDGLTRMKVEFIPIEGDRFRGVLEGPFGRYFNGPVYIVMAAGERSHFMIETGYQGEQAVLAATALGLGTCWIGALFDSEKLRSLLNLDASRRAIAVSPIGYASGKVVDAAMGGIIRRVYGSHKRLPMHDIVYTDHYKIPMESFTGDHSGWENIFEAVRLAPSWHNYQPWRFIISGRTVYALLVPPQGKPGAGSSPIKEGLDYTLLDLGIAMSHFDIAARNERIIGRWEIFDDDASKLRTSLKVPDDVRLIAAWK